MSVTEIEYGMDEKSRAEGLAALEEQARRDLERLNFPAPSWVLPVRAPDGRVALDVLIVGAGMCGQTAAFALMRDGVRNIRIVDRAPKGQEGPWSTYARMETLRSPKHLTGPDLGIPSLTFRAWYEAQYDREAWESLHKPGRLDWLAYLGWVRDLVGIPVENDTEVLSLEPDGDLIRADVRSPCGTETIHTRKVVLACGREGSGAPRMLTFPSFDPASNNVPRRLFHSSDAIDFASLAGTRMAVLGAGASAFDNAAVALESGVAEVKMFVRRPHLPQINKSKWTSFPGFMRGFHALDDESRWRFYTYIFREQVPPPYESVLRCDRHAGFSIRFAEGWTDVVPRSDGLTIVTSKGRYDVEAAVVATGFDVDLVQRAELKAFRDHVLVWGDRVSADAAQAHPEAARFPYLGDGMQLLEKIPGSCPQLTNLHVFNWGVTMSHGALAGDIPGLGIGATRLAQALVRDLFVKDAPRHFANLQAHDDSELKPTRYFIPPDQRR